MYIESLILNNYRKLKNKKIYFDKNLTIIYGKNAQGKTSIIEAIYFLATGKSFRTKKNLEQINYEKKDLILFAKTNSEDFSLKLTKDKKEFYISKNKVSYKEYIGKFLVVSFSPEDGSLIMDAPENRRKFFNYEIAQVDKFYLEDIIKFQKILKFRNRLLREKKTKDPLFEIYTKKFVELSVRIYKKRKEYIEKLSLYLNQKYKELFDIEKNLLIKYEAFFNFSENENMEEKFLSLLESKKEKEKELGFSVIGPHKDEFSFILNKQKVKTFASQGEKKSVIFSLKLAQIEYIINKRNETPIVLLDDIMAYFDEDRKKIVLEYFSKKNIQCIFTATEKAKINAKELYVKEGEVL